MTVCATQTERDATRSALSCAGDDLASSDAHEQLTGT